MFSAVNDAHAASEGISIHLAPDVTGHFFGVPITSTLLTTWLVMLMLIGSAYVLRRRLTLKPSKIQVLAEDLIGGVYNYVAQVLGGETHAGRFFPLILTIFIFILALNWVGLLPGVTSIGYYGESHGETRLIPYLYPANTDLNITIAFAFVAFVVIEVAGIMYLGAGKYLGKFVNISSPLNFLIGIIELFSELARLISFSFRLFGNIFAGKTLLLVAMFFMPFFVPVPLLAFEIFVGFIQAFIFAVLTLFFIKLAIEEPQH